MEFENFNIAMAAIFVLYVAIKDIIKPLIRKKLNGNEPHEIVAKLPSSLTKVIYDMQRETKDLYLWHAPDNSGRQVWRDPKDVITAINEMRTEIVSELKLLNRNGK